MRRNFNKDPVFFKAIARSPEKLEQNDIKANEILKAELTEPDSIRECCKGINVVISTVGITRQKDGLTYTQKEENYGTKNRNFRAHKIDWNSHENDAIE